MKIIFMGCAEFSVPTLLKIYKNFQLQAVFTSYPKPKDRGYVIQENPVHLAARNLNVPIITVKSMKTQEVLDKLNSIEADVIVVVAYGFILNSNVLNNKPLGAINLHPSDLPALRGPSPLQYTILNRLLKTKICVIKMDEGVDTGDILNSIPLDLPKNIDFPTLHDMCAHLGADLMCDTLKNIHNITPISQNSIILQNSIAKIQEFDSIKINHQEAYSNDEVQSSKRNLNICNNNEKMCVYNEVQKNCAMQQNEFKVTKKIKKIDGLIQIDELIENIYAKFLAFKIWPGLYFYFKSIQYKILDMQILTENNPQHNNLIDKNENNVQHLDTSSKIENTLNHNNFKNASYHYSGPSTAGKNEEDYDIPLQNFICIKQTLKIQVQNGYIQILKIQPQGKKPMEIKDFLNGYKNIFENN